MHRLRVDSHVARELNRALVYDLLRDRQVVSRIGLAHETGLSKATISQIIDEFITEQLVQTIGPGASQIGRRPTLLRFDPRARFVIGVEVGDMMCRALLTDLNGVPASTLVTTTHSPSPSAAIAATIDVVGSLLSEVRPETLLGIGIGMPGLVDSHCGTIRTAPDLGWYDISVGRPLAQRFGYPVTCLNRAKAAACGEAWSGAGEKVDHLVYLSISTGISAGIIFNHNLYRGISMSEGEIGHVTVLPDGPLCACGNRGCLQTVAAGPALLARLREKLRARGTRTTALLTSNDLDRYGLAAVRQAMATDDPVAHEVVAEAAQYMGLAAANLVNTLNPRMLIFGGDVVLAIPDLVPQVETVIRQRALSVPAAEVSVICSKLGEAAVPIGAAAFLLSQVSPVASDGVHAPGGGAAQPVVIRPVPESAHAAV